MAAVTARRGNTLWISLGVLFLAAMGVAMVSRAVQSGARETARLRHAEEARWAAQAALATFANRLKMRPWAERFYRDPKRPDRAPEYHRTQSFAGRDVELWARDSVRGSRVITGTTDVLAMAVEDGRPLTLVQRLRITPAVATNPRALHVLRELTVKAAAGEVAERDALVRQLADDEARADEGAALAEVSARGMDLAAGEELDPERAIERVRAQAGEEGGEKRFRELMQKGHARLDVVDFAGAASLFEEASRVGGAGVHEQQRRMAGELAAARARYALALSAPESRRAALANDAARLLDRMVNELGTECAGPTAAYLKAQIDVMAARRRGASAAGTDDTVSRITDDLKRLLGRLGPGRSFEGGSVPVDQLPPQFQESSVMNLAYTDSFLEERDLRILWFVIPTYWPVSQRLSLTGERGERIRTLISSGQYDPCLWIAGGQALVVTDHGGDSGYDYLILDRTGKIIAGFRGVKPIATAESGGIWISPDGDALVIFGVGPHDEMGYWVQDLTSPSPPRRVGPAMASDSIIDHDPLQFSQTGGAVAYVDPAGKVIVESSKSFLAGQPGEKSYLTFKPEKPYLRAPAFAWVGHRLTREFLVAFTHEDDRGNPDAGRLVIVERGLFTRTTKRGIVLPQGFTPGLIVPLRTSEGMVVLDRDNAHYLRASVRDAEAPRVETLPEASYQTRPGRGGDDVIYLAGAVSRTEPGIWRWDLATGRAPERLPLPPETGPTKFHVITTPVSY